MNAPFGTSNETIKYTTNLIPKQVKIGLINFKI